MQIAIDGLTHLRIYHQAAIEVVYLTINEAGIAVLPPTYIDYIKVGMTVSGSNDLYILGINPRMALNRAQECGEDIRVMSTAGVGISDGYFFTPHERNGSYVPTLYGIGGGFARAYFKIDKEAGQIQFDGSIPNGEIVLEFKSTGVGPGTVVNRVCIKPIKDWMGYHSIKRNLTIPMNQKQLMKQDLEESIKELRAFNQKFTMREYMDTLYRSKKQTPKP